MNPLNWSWTVSDKAESITTESCGSSFVKSGSKFATSKTDSCLSIQCNTINQQSATHNAWLERWLYFFGKKAAKKWFEMPPICQIKDIPIPVNIFCKERMLLYFLATICSKALGWIPLQQSSHHTFSLRWDIWWEIQRVGQDTLIHRVHIFVIEWGKTGLWRKTITNILPSVVKGTYHHFIKKDTKRPPIDSLRIALAF